MTGERGVWARVRGGSVLHLWTSTPDRRMVVSLCGQRRNPANTRIDDEPGRPPCRKCMRIYDRPAAEARANGLRP